MARQLSLFDSNVSQVNSRASDPRNRVYASVADVASKLGQAPDLVVSCVPADVTLAAAALFSPLRRRVQHAVDRRFNRARYDAGRTVAAFAASLKDAVDLDSIRDDLARTVQQALEPAHLSVWISRHSGGPRR